MGAVTVEDIENEASAITALMNLKRHSNIIGILGHGWLQQDQLYYIDMELCDVSLAVYILGPRPPLFSSRVPADHNTLEIPYTQEYENIDLKVVNIWTIVIHIARGLEFLHRHNRVHRDLKPENGIWDYFIY